MICPLCSSGTTTLFHSDNHREYYRCKDCALVFVPEKYYLTAAQEKAEYDLHQNSPYDPGYRRFLSRLFEPLRSRLAPGARGLDFGCGPGPALAAMFREADFEVDIYDPFYAPDTIFRGPYDFITASEVAEHLHDPGTDFKRLHQLLVPGGILGIMTKLVIDQEAFSRWHYKNDLTHVCFFSQPTFSWLAEKLDAHCEFIAKDVILLTRS